MVKRFRTHIIRKVVGLDEVVRMIVRVIVVLAVVKRFHKRWVHCVNAEVPVKFLPRVFYVMLLR